MLNLKEINENMNKLTDWSLEADSISKQIIFDDFKEAVDFLVKVSQVVEKHNHSPNVILMEKIVKLTLSTREENGLTKKDFEVAEEIDKIPLNN